MTKNRAATLVPVLTSQAGLCLTAANWQEAGITTASFYLSDLLMKPGADFLKTLPNLADYVSWKTNLVLNATLPKPSSTGLYTIRSRYDGSKKQYTVDDLLQIMVSLRPTMVVLPGGSTSKILEFWQELPESMTLIVPFINPLVNNISVWGDVLTKKNKPLFEDLEPPLTTGESSPYYVAGELDLNEMLSLAQQGAVLIESDVPAREACLGRVYSREGVLSLDDTMFLMQFDVIDKTCQCPVCLQQLTRSYLHHLLAQTPLLCQRLLVQHNIFYCQRALRAKGAMKTPMIP